MKIGFIQSLANCIERNRPVRIVKPKPILGKNNIINSQIKDKLKEESL